MKIQPTITCVVSRVGVGVGVGVGTGREETVTASLGLIYPSGTTGRPKGVLCELMSREQLLAGRRSRQAS